MNSAELRSVVHELLLEEITALRKERNTAAARPQENVVGDADTALPVQVPNETCWVPMRSESDLAMFARRVLQLAEDPGKREAIAGGVFPFRFDQPANSSPASGVNPATSAAALESRFDNGLVNEKQLSKLPPGTTVLRLGKRATITPLARDKARKIGITIKKVT